MLHIFCSYAEIDKPLVESLRAQMHPLDRWDVEMYYVYDALAGAQWERERDEQFNKAQIILLLISADFMAAEEHKNEIEQALARGREIQVIPVILRPTDWQSTPLGKLTPLPEGGRAVTQWENRDEAFHSIATGLLRIIRADQSLRRLAGVGDERGSDSSTGAKPSSPSYESRPTKIRQTYQASRDGNKGTASFLLHGTEHTLEYLRRDNVFEKQVFTLTWRQQEVARLEMPFGTLKKLEKQVSFMIDGVDSVLHVKMAAFTGMMSVKVLVGGVEVFHNW
jgi:hypothetical protein